MTALKIEQMPLPPKLPVYISLVQSIFCCIFSLIFLFFNLYFFAMGFSSFIGGKSTFFTLILHSLYAAMAVLFSPLIFFQSLKDIVNAGVPTLVFTTYGLQVRSFNIPWANIKELTMRNVPGYRRHAILYAQVVLYNAASFPSGDITETEIPFIFKYYKYRLAPPPNTVLIPLQGFDKAPNELMILLKRYCSNATGQL